MNKKNQEHYYIEVDDGETYGNVWATDSMDAANKAIKKIIKIRKKIT